jgi:hypothetical protein
MKISVDDTELYTLTTTQKNVIKNDINADVFDDDMKRRLKYILTHKYEQCFRRLKAEWEPKLIALGHETIPTDPDAFAQLVFAEPTYKDRKTRDDEAAQQ